jgi:hypothetical protein
VRKAPLPRLVGEGLCLGQLLEPLRGRQLEMPTEQLAIDVSGQQLGELFE